jgi:Flp pilus assembly protein CpaB
MRSRGLVVAIAVVLAVLAAVGVIVYTNSVRDEVISENTVNVIVSNQDIPTNTQLNSLITAGAFETRAVPRDVLVAGAVTSLDELRDQTTAAPILANEQIPISRLESGELNVVGISPDHVGLGMQLEGPRSVNGLIQRGDSIVVYATFPKNTPVLRTTLKTLLSPARFEEFLQAFGAATGTPTQPAAQPGEEAVFLMPVDFTVTLVPSVKVLSVQNPPIDATTGRRGEGGTTLVLDAVPSDASQLVFANEKATLWLGLLPPENEDGYDEEAVIGLPNVKVIGVGA